MRPERNNGIEKANHLDHQEIKGISTLAAKRGCPSAWEPSHRQGVTNEVTERSVDEVMLIADSTAII
jgi:hypothetical protein